MPRELAYYYPNPMWSHGDWIKNLILFFDGVALLVPHYMRDKPEAVDGHSSGPEREEAAGNNRAGSGGGQAGN